MTDGRPIAWAAAFTGIFLISSALFALAASNFATVPDGDEVGSFLLQSALWLAVAAGASPLLGLVGEVVLGGWRWWGARDPSERPE